MATELIDQGAQPERTALSWLRTAASTSFASLFLFRYLLEAGNQALAFLLGGLAILIAPALLIVGLRRVDRATENWQSSVQNQSGTLFVSLSVGTIGLLTAITVLLV